MARHRSRRNQLVSELLMWLAQVAEKECPDGHGTALADLGALAAIKVPSRGVLWKAHDHGEDDLLQAIERIARDHLGYAEPDAAFSLSLEAIAAKTTIGERSALEKSRIDAEVISDAPTTMWV